MRNVYSVKQVNSYVKNMFSQDFMLNHIYVKGEVSNCKYHTSGHIYFSLKDESGTIACVMFASARSGLSFRMQEGQNVIVLGSVSVYERDGKYQLYAKEIILDGAGALYERFEALKKELEEMGMFAAEYKRPIPRYAMNIGVVTASTGAAIRDIMNITARRNPYVQLMLYPALVQGDGAVASIVAGIRALDALGLDVLIVGRGGGSIEDLWAFNEEPVARAIFECHTPVISAVGHETDVTIADYVADLRAPTPSAAAELAVFDYRQFEEQLMAYRAALNRSMERQAERRRYLAEQYRLRLKLHDPERLLRDKRQRLADIQQRLQSTMEQRLLDARHKLALAGGRLHGLSPLEKISRGFAFVTDGSDRRVESVRQVEPGDMVTLHITDGRITAQVTEREDVTYG